MCEEQGFIAVHERVRLVKFIGKGCSIFFSSAYVTLLSTTCYKVLRILSIRPELWSTWPPGPDLTTTEQSSTISGLC